MLVSALVANTFRCCSVPAQKGMEPWTAEVAAPWINLMNITILHRMDAEIVAFVHCLHSTDMGNQGPSSAQQGYDI